MTIESLTSEIDAAREQFREINDLHWRWVKDEITRKKRKVYSQLLPETEHKIGELADRLARLYAFRSRLSARSIDEIRLIAQHA